jgi:hypothetical protein
LHRVGRQRPGRRQLPAEREPVSLRFNDLSTGRLLVLKAILWIETDDNTFTDVTNAMLLAAVPGVHGDGGKITVVNKADGSPNRTVTADNLSRPSWAKDDGRDLQAFPDGTRRR